MVVLAACGGDTSKGSAEGPSESSGKRGAEVTCASLSKEEAERILGGPIDAPSPASAPSTGCSWNLANTGLSVQGITALNQQPFIFDGTQTARRTGQVDGLFTFEDVSGVGDAAFYQTNKQQSSSSLVALTILQVKQGDRSYNISVIKKGASLDEIKRLELEAAQAILN
jgi:hypothetical protein